MPVEEKNCPQMDSCEMYEIFRNSGALGTWKAFFCKATFENCARYKLVSLGRSVAPNLMPNGELLGSAKKTSP